MPSTTALTADFFGGATLAPASARVAAPKLDPKVVEKERQQIAAAKQKRIDDQRIANNEKVRAQQRADQKWQRDYEARMKVDPGPEGQRWRAQQKKIHSAGVDWGLIPAGAKVLGTGAAVIATGGAVAGALGVTAAAGTAAAATTASQAISAATKAAETAHAVSRGNIGATVNVAATGLGAAGVKAPPLPSVANVGKEAMAALPKVKVKAPSAKDALNTAKTAAKQTASSAAKAATTKAKQTATAAVKAVTKPVAAAAAKPKAVVSAAAKVVAKPVAAVAKPALVASKTTGVSIDTKTGKFVSTKPAAVTASTAAVLKLASTPQSAADKAAAAALKGVANVAGVKTLLSLASPKPASATTTGTKTTTGLLKQPLPVKPAKPPAAVPSGATPAAPPKAAAPTGAPPAAPTSAAKVPKGTQVEGILILPNGVVDLTTRKWVRAS